MLLDRGREGERGRVIMEPVILRAWNTDPKKFSPLEKRKAKRKTFLSLAVDVFSDDRTAHITVVGVYSIVPILVLLPRKVQVFPWTSVVVADVASLRGWQKKVAESENF